MLGRYRATISHLKPVSGPFLMPFTIFPFLYLYPRSGVCGRFPFLLVMVGPCGFEAWFVIRERDFPFRCLSIAI